MKPETLAVTIALFGSLAALSILLPPRYGVVAFMLLSQFDFTSSFSDSSLGWENALKVVLIPTILLWRMRPIEALPAAFGSVRNLWLFFIAYAGLAIAWSPFRLSGIKMMGYFYSYSVVFLILTSAWRRRWLRRGTLIFVAWTSIAFAVAQTYLLGNFYGNTDNEGRFTSFTGAQSFAPFLVCLFVLLIVCVRSNAGSLIAAAATAVGLVLTGSRYNFAGFAWVLLIVSIALANQYRHRVSFAVIARNVIFGGIAILLLGSFALYSLPKNRLNELFDAFTSRNTSVADVETFAWRLTIYGETIKQLSERSLPGLLVGSGTSSGATVALQTGYYMEANVDPNRCIHDEFLRSLYEWGGFGFLSFVAFLWLIIRLSVRIARKANSPHAWASIAIFGPLLIGLLVENILALGASPAGVGYCAIFGSMVAQLRPATAQLKLKRPALIHSGETAGGLSA